MDTDNLVTTVNKNRLYATFMELCRIDSESLRERQMADFFQQRLTDMGFTLFEDDAAGKIGGNAGNLIARLDGTGSGERILFSCHLDRVVPGVGVKPRIDGDYIVCDGTTILGADDAAGLAAILEGLEVLQEHGKAHPPLELVLTVAEELALLGSRHFDTGRIMSRYGFVLDASGPVGEIVVQAPEQVKFKAVFHGRKAHAGFSPELGISAIQIAGYAISRMQLSRIDYETTANISSIKADGPTNIVSDRCEIFGEVRSLDPVKLKVQLETMSAVMENAANEFGGSVDITVIPCYPSYKHAGNAEPVRIAVRAAEFIGAPVHLKSTGGGSDANIFNNSGIPTVVLSCGYENPHTTEEKIPLEQLVRLTEWFLAIVCDEGVLAGVESL